MSLWYVSVFVSNARSVKEERMISDRMIERSVKKKRTPKGCDSSLVGGVVERGAFFRTLKRAGWDYSSSVRLVPFLYISN
jgi:hypothetical protein